MKTIIDKIMGWGSIIIEKTLIWGSIMVIGFVVFVWIAISVEDIPWRRFRREPPSTYIELARTCKSLLEQNGLFDTNSTAAIDSWYLKNGYMSLSVTKGISTEVYVDEISSKTIRLDPQMVSFSERMRRYSPRRVILSRNYVFIACKSRDIAVRVRFSQVLNKWSVTLRVSDMNETCLLWEGNLDEP